MLHLDLFSAKGWILSLWSFMTSPQVRLKQRLEVVCILFVSMCPYALHI